MGLKMKKSEESTDSFNTQNQFLKVILIVSFCTVILDCNYKKKDFKWVPATSRFKGGLECSSHSSPSITQTLVFFKKNYLVPQNHFQ